MPQYFSNPTPLQQRLAERLLRSGASTQPIRHWSDGLSRGIQSIAGAMLANRVQESNQKLAENKDKALRKQFTEQIGEDMTDTLQLGQQWGGTAVNVPTSEAPPDAQAPPGQDVPFVAGDQTVMAMPDSDERVGRPIMGLSPMGQMMVYMNQASAREGGISPQAMQQVYMNNLRNQQMSDMLDKRLGVQQGMQSQRLDAMSGMQDQRLENQANMQQSRLGAMQGMQDQRLENQRKLQGARLDEMAAMQRERLTQGRDLQDDRLEQAEQMAKTNREFRSELQDKSSQDAMNRMIWGQALKAETGQDLTANQRDFMFAQENPEYAKFLEGSGNTNDPSSVAEFKYFNALPKDQQQKFLTMKRATKTIDLGGSVITPDPTNPAGAPIKQIPKTLPPERTPEHLGDVERSKKSAIFQQELVDLRPQTDMLMSQTMRKTGMIDGNLDEIDKLLEGGTATGFIGAVAGRMPWETDASQMEDYLITVKANLGFDQLQAMREASKTGGALGSVSEMENKTLQAVNGALNAKNETSLRRNLKVIRELYPQIVRERQEMYKKHYGSYYGGYTPGKAKESAGGGDKFKGWSIKVK